MERNCAFQYYNGRKMVKDISNLTIEEAKNLFNEYYDDMVKKQENPFYDDIECAIWVNMAHETNYHDKLIHISNCEVYHGHLTERIYYNKF